MFMHCTRLWRQLNLLRAPFSFLLLESTWNKSASLLSTRNAVLPPDWTLIGGDVTARSIIGSRAAAQPASEARMPPPHGHEAPSVIPTLEGDAASPPHKGLTRAFHYSPGKLNNIAIVLVKVFFWGGVKKKVFSTHRLLLLSLLGVKHSHEVFKSPMMEQYCKKVCNCPLKVHVRGLFSDMQT